MGKATHGPPSPSLSTTPDVCVFTYVCGYQLLNTELDYSVRVIFKSAFINQAIFVATCHGPGTIPGAQMGQRARASVLVPQPARWWGGGRRRESHPREVRVWEGIVACGNELAGGTKLPQASRNIISGHKHFSVANCTLNPGHTKAPEE